MAKIKVIQCSSCGQIVQGDYPENLPRVCLECCDRIKHPTGDPANPPYIIFTVEAPVEPFPCRGRHEAAADCRDKEC